MFAAKQGWEVSAFDSSTEGMKKALQLAEENGVEINYHTTELSRQGYEKGEFDAVALIYAHFLPEERKDYFKFFSYILKPGRVVILKVLDLNIPLIRKRIQR